MKSSTYIASVLAVLLMSAAWFVGRDNFTHPDKTEHADKSVKFSNGGDQGTGISSPPSKRKGSRPEGAVVALQSMLSYVASLPHAQGIDLDVLENLRAKLDSMETEELMAILRELDDSQVDSRLKQRLEGLIAGALARRDPRLSLDTFIPRTDSQTHGLNRQMLVIYTIWVGKDQEAAAEWFDKIPGDVAMVNRAGFEAALIRIWAAKDPAKAAERLAVVDKPMREQILNYDWFALPGSEKSVADFLRAEIPDTSMLVRAASARLRQGDLMSVSAFIEQIEPEASERAALVAEALRSRILVGDELRISAQEAHDWILQQAPKNADHLTGLMLGQMTAWHDFSIMAEQAMNFSDGNGDGAIFVSFLKNAPDSYRIEILELAKKISDPVAKYEIERRFINNPNQGPEALQSID